jgi:hypothetical protein
MNASTGTKNYKFTLTATTEQEIDGKKVRFVETKRDGEVVQNQGYLADPSGVHWVAFDADAKGRVVPPMTVLQLPLKRGAAWDWMGKFESADGSFDGEAKFRVTDQDMIKTPAGSYIAYKVEQTIMQTTPEGRVETVNVQWFAPKVGLLKQETTTSGSVVTAELTKHTAPP